MPGRDRVRWTSRRASRRRRPAARGAVPALGRAGDDRAAARRGRAALPLRRGRPRGGEDLRVPGAPATWSRCAAAVRRGGRALPVEGPLGPGLGNPTAAERRSRATTPPQARRTRRRPASSACRPRRSGPRAPVAACAGSASRATTSRALWVPAARPRGGGAARASTLPGGDGQPELGRWPRSPLAARRSRRSCTWAQGLLRALAARPRPGRGGAGRRLARAHRGPPHGAAALGPRPRRQLRLVDRGPHRAHQPGHGPAAALQHRQRPQDGQAGPGDAGHPGALPQGARCWTRERQEMQKEIGGPLRAPRHEHGHPDAGGLPARSCSPCRSCSPSTACSRCRSSCGARASCGSRTSARGTRSSSRPS